MGDLIPILLRYVGSRQKPGGCVVLVAHNARGFDVPFLIKEFSRCSFDIPPNWLFVDTLPLAREVMKSGGLSTCLNLCLFIKKSNCFGSSYLDIFYFHFPIRHKGSSKSLFASSWSTLWDPISWFSS